MQGPSCMRDQQAMIKLFRKIRYAPIAKNNTGKYLEYAVGEIIPVVVGSLIALTINNWNDKNIEIEYQMG
jgi:hypothetical protein